MKLGGKRLVLGVAALEAVAVAVGLTRLGLGAEGWHWAMRWTARVSALLFLSAFLASSLQRRFHRPWTGWLRRRRRYLGLSFAASQGIHLFAIAGGFLRAPATMSPPNATFMVGALGYAFTVALALTSTDG